MSSTAAEKLKPSKLDQTGLMKHDVDLTSFFIEMRDKAGINLVTAITSAQVSRTIEGASTLEVTVDDDISRTIQKSGKLGRKVDVNVDGLWWTLKGINKTGRSVRLTFEEREVNLMRYYQSFKYASRDDMTRAQFVLSMIKEVTEEPLQWVIPELLVDQPISDLQPGQVLINSQGIVQKTTLDQATADYNREQGIHLSTKLTVKGAPATAEQIGNANIILQTAKQMKAPAKVMVAAINTAITESTIHNLTGGDRDSVGIFQQRPSQGWPASRDIPTDTAAFVSRAITINEQFPNISVAALCQSVQHSGTADGSNYAPWTTEAEQFVNAFGTEIPNSVREAVTTAQKNATALNTTTAGVGKLFVRGTITKKNGYTILTPENSWACANRLGNEVNWRMFCVSGVMYFISEQYLFKSRPFMIISEDSPGIDTIDYDYDEGKRQATVEITAHLSRWSAPPGSTIQIQDQGIIDGKWLVHEVERSLFETTATITCSKPNPILPEPTNLVSLTSGGIPGTPKAKVAGQSSVEVETGHAKLNKTQQKIIQYATDQLGVPYVWGGETPGVAFDCSGLTAAAYGVAGISLPHSSQLQWSRGPVVDAPDIVQPADLVFFVGSDGTFSAPGHVGIYIGQGRMIVAPHTGSVVMIQTISTSNQNPNDPNAFVGATRPWI